MKSVFLIVAVSLLAACQPAADKPEVAEEVPAAAPAVTGDSLADILAAQPDEAKARYAHRNPQQTIEFFGIEPGMTVVEALPGAGWYTKILLPYLGKKGGLIAVNYSLEMYPLFSFATEEFMERQRAWQETFVSDAPMWGGENSAEVKAHHFGSVPDELAGSADVVLFVRAMHNLARFESQGDYLTTALQDVYSLLKPGGTFGIVQHQAREELPDSFADGSNGYLKRDFIVSVVEQAGFEFVAESGINANPADQPGEGDIVWRLPPSLVTSREDPELRAQYEAVGESNRITLKFRKP